MGTLRRHTVLVSLVLALMGGLLTLPSPGPAGADVAGGTGATEGRPYGLNVPDSYDGSKPVPLVVLLHGYTGNGPGQAAYFGMLAESDRSGFVLAYPDGTRDVLGNRFWNATDACCDFFHTGVDDVAYLDAVIAEITGKYRINPARVYLAGHSNGAFMAHRYACDRPGTVAAFVALAGMQWKDQGHCGASTPVSVLHVHGRNDMTINYAGGSTPGGPYPGAVETVGDWAAKDSCAGTLAPTDRKLDLDRGVPGDETAVQTYGDCPSGTAVELWTIEGGGHVPAFTDAWAPSIWGFLQAHPKVSPAAG